VTRDEWIASFAEAAGVTAPSAHEVGELLALAGVAAHASERTAAPVACWVAARSGRPLEELLSLAKGLAADADAPG
jgi:hypothetical protein